MSCFRRSTLFVACLMAGWGLSARIAVSADEIHPATDRPLPKFADGRVQDRRPVELPVVVVFACARIDDGVDDRRLALEQSAPRQRHQGMALEQPPRDLGGGDRLHRAAAQITEDPAVVAKAREGQSQPAPGLVKVWELAHAPRLWPARQSSLMPDSPFPQESLNLILCPPGPGVAAKLLVVDDEPRTAELTADVLRRAGYAVEVAGSGTEALERVRIGSPDLMLLDYDMPDMEAPEVLDSLRSGADRIPFPVIILTGARHAPADQVVGLERGATYYIAKGTDRQVVLARVHGALRDRTLSAGAITRGRLRVDASRAEARLGDRLLKLDRRPLLLLETLANRPGEVVSRAELLEKVWGSSYRGFEHSVEQAVHQVRRELHEVGWIETVRGIGYRLVVQP